MKRTSGSLLDLGSGSDEALGDPSDRWAAVASRLRTAIGALTAPGEAVFVSLPFLAREGPWNPDWDYEQQPFAQVDVSPGFALRTIFGSNQFLAPQFKIGPAAQEAMLRLGFTEPRDLNPNDPQEFSWHHYFLREDMPLGRIDAMLATVIVRGFRDCFGVDDPAKLRFIQWSCDWRS